MKKVLGLVFLAVIGIVLAGCGSKTTSTSTKVNTPPPPPAIGTDTASSDAATP